MSSNPHAHDTAVIFSWHGQAFAMEQSAGYSQSVYNSSSDMRKPGMSFMIAVVGGDPIGSYEILYAGSPIHLRD